MQKGFLRSETERNEWRIRGSCNVRCVWKAASGSVIFSFFNAKSTPIRIFIGHVRLPVSEREGGNLGCECGLDF